MLVFVLHSRNPRFFYLGCSDDRPLAFVLSILIVPVNLYLVITIPVISRYVRHEIYYYYYLDGNSLEISLDVQFNQCTLQNSNLIHSG